MSEDLTKGKKRGKTSVHMYFNMNRPHSSPGEVLAQIPPEEDVDKSKKKGKRRFSERMRNLEQLHENGHQATPQHSAAEGYQREMAKPDCDKGDNSRFQSAGVPTPGNPVNVPDFASMRDSQPVTDGHAANSAGNAGNQYVPGPRELAFNHPDMRNGRTEISPFARLKPEQNAGYIGTMAMSHAQRNSAMLQTQEPADVAVSRMNSRGNAGAPDYRATPSGNPQRQPAHTARNSATPPNGSPLDILTGAGVNARAVTPPRQSMKNSDALGIIKSALAEQGFGR